LLAAVVLTALAITTPSTAAQAADEAAQAQDGGASEGGQATESKPKTSAVVWFLKASGPIGAFILILSIYFVATVSRLFWEFRLEIAMPPEIVQKSQEMLEQRDFKGVFAVVKDDPSIYSRLLTIGITELPNGLAEARDAMERVGEVVRVEMEKRISPLAVLGTLGPMIGLVGTLWGMIDSFSVIARSDAGMRTSEVAAGISSALVLTFEGVSLSVPAIWFYSFFRNRMMVITTAVGLEADQFLRHFAHAARVKTPPAGGAAKVATRLE
jgi:biopolymer transport protein ExbB